MGWSIESGPITFSPKATDEYIDIAYMIRYDPGDGGIFKFLSRQKNDTTGFTRALEMAERIVRAEGMTVDDLLAKLDAEYVRLESGLPEHYLAYGRYCYAYPGDVGSYHYDKQQITDIRARQKVIRYFQDQLKQETERTQHETTRLTRQ